MFLAHNGLLCKPDPMDNPAAGPRHDNHLVGANRTASNQKMYSASGILGTPTHTHHRLFGKHDPHNSYVQDRSRPTHAGDCSCQTSKYRDQHNAFLHIFASNPARHHIPPPRSSAADNPDPKGTNEVPTPNNLFQASPHNEESLRHYNTAHLPDTPLGNHPPYNCSPTPQINPIHKQIVQFSWWTTQTLPAAQCRCA
jgi:hypothetical protein